MDRPADRHDEEPGAGPARAPEHRTRRRVLKGVAWVVGGVVGLLLLVVAAVLVVTNTDWGRERVRRFAVNTLNDLAHGEVRIGRLDGNLLTGVVASGLSITDSTGAPLVTADTVATRFDLLALARKRIVLRDARLVHPLIVLDQPPGADWNFARIFPGDTTAQDTLAGPGWGSWFRVEDLRIRDGRVIVRQPWAPDAGLTGAARDSAVAAALSPESRAAIVAVPGGWQTVYDFRHVTGHFPLLRIADPDEAARLFEVASLQTEAYPFRPPAAQLRDLRGRFMIAEDSAWFVAEEIRFPSSRLAVNGTFRFGDAGSTTIQAQARPVALADMQFAYPALPDTGQGTLDASVAFNGDTMQIAVRDTDLRVDGATLAGDLGIVLVHDTLAFRDTDVRFAGVDTRLIEQLAPGVELPRSGVLGGRAALDGTIASLAVDADVSFVDRVVGRSRVAARGRLGVREGVFAANDLRVTLDPVQVALARAFVPDLPVGGTLSGQATMNGATDGSILLANMDLTHREDGQRSRVTGRAAIRRSPSLYLDIDADLRPLSLATVGRFAPGIGLRGTAAGPLRVRGTLGDLAVDTDLRFNDGGTLAAEGRLDLEGTIGYDVRARMALFNPQAIVSRAPFRTSLTATARARGEGTDPATLRAELAADLATSSVDTVAVDSAHVRVRAADGLATIDTVAVHGPGTLVAAAGTFGLRGDRSGEVVYRVQVDSLAAFAQFLGVPDTTAVPPRPAIAARALARARADSARVAEATLVERMATGRAGPTLAPVEAPAEIPSDSVAGSLYAAGVARGSIKHVDVRGRAGVLNLVARGNVVNAGRVEYAWINGFTPQAALAAAARLDTVRAAGFALDSVDARVAYQGEQGTVDVVINQQADVDYRAVANFRLALDESELTFQQLALRFDTRTWEAAHPGAVRWGPRGVYIDSLDLRNGPTGRIFVNGLVPTEGDADLQAQITEFQVGDAVALLQSDIQARGLLTLDARMTGPATAPRITGAVGLVEGQYSEAALPDVRATLDYADQTLATRAELLRPEGGAPLARAEGALPINLALRTDEPRMPDRPIRLDLDADSLPLGLIPQFTDALADVDGRAFGAVRVRGTLKEPELVGALSLLGGRARLVPLGVSLRDIAARIRLAGDTVVVDSLVGYNTGRVFVRGGLGIQQITQPSFDLYLVANNATVLNNDMGRIRADAGIAARGPFDGLYVSGAARINEGVIQLPESDGKDVLPADDPAVFAVMDTAIVDPSIVPQTSPLIANLRMNVRLGIERDTWVRGRDANVEIFTPDDPGPLEIIVDQRRKQLSLRGLVATERGEYTFLGKRFQVSSGTVNFLGGTELNPLLQLTALYEVNMPAQEALLIRIIIGGTLKNLQLSLESDAQPPIAQSDLIAYLALGRSSSSLLDFNQGSSLTSGGAGGNFVGAGAALATQRLAGIGVGVLVDQLEGDAARSLGADVFHITPADISIEAANPLSGFDALVRGTEVEAGKYVNRRTFVSLTFRPAVFAPTADERAIPGVRVQYRFGERLRLEANYEGRYRVRPPTLEEQQSLVSTGVFGLFLRREWGW